MFEFIQSIAIVMLSGVVIWLWKSRPNFAVPGWLTETDEDDLVKQADLDQYHHRVVQLSHVQRDLLLKKIESLEGRIREFESSGKSWDPITDSPPPPVTKSEAPRPRATEISEKVLDPAGGDSEVTEAVFTEEDVFRSDSPIAGDPSVRVLRLWREGKPSDEIAKELRMGRQEVQLLIEMSRHSPVGAPKG